MLSNYPFPTPRTRVVEAADIREVVKWHPPALRMRDREFLMVGGTEFDGLKHWCAEHGVPVVNRYDAWADLLEPFLDTEIGAAGTEATYLRLAQHGFDRPEVETLRAEVDKPMIYLTALTWEWVHYGIYDVLRATHPVPSFFWRRERRAFVRRVMAVAERGCAAS